MSYTIVLTHDMDHLALRNVPFFSRASGSYLKRNVYSNFLRWTGGHIGAGRYLRSLAAAAALPLVKTGLAADPLRKCLDRILDIENHYRVKSTFYFIPFKDTAGFEEPGVPAPRSRGCDYDVRNYKELLTELDANGWEIGIHGIDAHLGKDEAQNELALFQSLLPNKQKWGMRVHWLYQPPNLWKVLKEAGYFYDATFGSNDDTGFIEDRYLPFTRDGLRVLPLTIQDGSLLAHWHSELSPEKAWSRIREILDTAKEKGAVVTILWHNASFGAPRFWDGLYRRIIEAGKEDGATFLTALQAVEQTGGAA